MFMCVGGREVREVVVLYLCWVWGVLVCVLTNFCWLACCIGGGRGGYLNLTVYCSVCL